MHSCRKLVLCGSLALIAGAFLPWSEWGCPSLHSSVHILGLDGEGSASAIIGLLLLGMCLTKRAKPSSHYSLIGTLLASCAGAIAAENIFEVAGKISATLAESSTDIVASVGIGLFVTLAGALLALGGALLPVRVVQTSA